MDINPSGETVSYSIHKSVIHTTERMTYVDVQKILEDDAQMLARYAHIQQDIKRMERLANILSARRKRRGSIDFNTSEAKITLKEDGTPDTITRVERLFAHRLIEEFMLAANETVAKHIALKNGPFVYRVHEVMGEEKARELMTFLGAFGIDLTKDASQVKPMEVQQALLAAQGKKEERLINITVLRAMKKARYAAENLGHFGLAATYYCHFTSPIRRYPDLMVHRMLKKDIAGELNKDGQTADEKMRMEEIAVQCSACELRAMEAERAVESYMKAKYMEQRLGEIYDGVISGITPNGVFVELDNTIEGFVRLEDLGRELRYEKESYRFVDASGRVISIGQPMRVQVAAANAELRRIDFVPVADTDPQVS
jgi:ribonuclease R